VRGDRETGTILGEIAALRGARAPGYHARRCPRPALLRVGAEEFPDYLAAHPSALRRGAAANWPSALSTPARN
jgi:hypothetical protein